MYLGKTDFEGYPICDSDPYSEYKKGKWGFINNLGEVMVPAIYDSVADFQDGKALAKLNDEEFYIDLNGQRVKP